MISKKSVVKREDDLRDCQYDKHVCVKLDRKKLLEMTKGVLEEIRDDITW